MTGWAAKTLAIIIIVGLLLSYFPQIFVIGIVCIILLFIIRWIADIYWNVKDNER